MVLVVGGRGLCYIYAKGVSQTSSVDQINEGASPDRVWAEQCMFALGFSSVIPL